jgi:hypothetical protein
MLPERKRIAVVGVHGVADQQPYETATTIAGLLANTGNYEPFRESRFHLDIAALDVQSPQPGDPQDIRFAREVLQSPDDFGPEEAYQTIRFEALRQGTHETEVHVYEAYWADLSRLSQSFVRIFGELYQLFFHLSQVAVHTVQAACCEHQETKPWKRLLRFVDRASWALSTPIPIFNLFLGGVMFVIVLLWALLRLEDFTQKATTAVFACVAFSTAIGFLLSRMGRIPRTLWFVSGPIGPLLGGLLLWFFWKQPSSGRFGHLHVFCILVAIAVSLILSRVISAYNRRRPGAARFARWGGSLTGALFLANILASGTQTEISLGLLYTGRMIMVILAIFWGVFLFTTPAAHIASWLIPKPSRADRRAIQTARILLAVPSFGFLVVTVSVWSAALPQLIKLAPRDFLYMAPDWRLPQHVTRFIFGLDPGIFLSPSELPALTLIRGLAQALPLMLPFAAVAFFAAGWSIVRVAATESSIPKRGAENIRQWLDYGYQNFVFAGTMLYFPMAVIGPVAGAYWFFEGPIFFPELTRKIVFGMGVWVGGSAVGVSAFRGTMEKVALNLHTILDVLLDVDNHLKQQPRGSNIRLKITARYISLLRYIHSLNYDGVIIIAHSQGSVITADLLRLLQVEWPPAPRRLIYFFTMGCPLAQLYEWRFPHLYAWTCSHQGLSGPDPAQLYGVRSWVNAYRTGDYVGRQLWDGHPPPNCEEFSIGPGAHTHYWDRTAPQIRDRLDQLVAEAAA